VRGPSTCSGETQTQTPSRSPSSRSRDSPNAAKAAKAPPAAKVKAAPAKAKAVRASAEKAAETVTMQRGSGKAVEKASEKADEVVIKVTAPAEKADEKVVGSAKKLPSMRQSADKTAPTASPVKRPTSARKPTASTGPAKEALSNPKRAARVRKPSNNPKAEESRPKVTAGAQFSTSEAKALQEELQKGFKERDFQQALKSLQKDFPSRKKRGHHHGTAYFEAFEALTLTVFHEVLLNSGLSGDWDGVRDMQARMQTAMSDRTVRKLSEEINVLLGLPRDAILAKPARKSEEMFTYCPHGDGDVPGYTRPLLVDDDGDEGHEFFEEDPETGELQEC